MPVAEDLETPPRSTEELRELMQQVQAGNAPVRLGGRAARAVTAMLEAPRQTAVFSITELAEALDINPSTLTRVAKRLGFAGFSELQGLFRAQVAGSGQFYSAQAGRLAALGQGQARGLIDRVGGDEITNLQTMSANLDEQVLVAAAETLVRARRVRVLGLRQFGAVGSFAAYALGMLRRDTAVLTDNQHGIAHALAQLEAGDALLVIGCAPYTRGTVAAARIAAAHDLRVIAITDSPSSPLGSVGDHVFYTPTSGVFYGNCMAATVVLIEMLLSVVAQRLGDQAVGALRRHETLISELNIEL